MIPDPCSLSADRVLAQRLLLAYVWPSVGQLDLLRPELSFKWEIIHLRTRGDAVGTTLSSVLAFGIRVRRGARPG